MWLIFYKANTLMVIRYGIIVFNNATKKTTILLNSILITIMCLCVKICNGKICKRVFSTCVTCVLFIKFYYFCLVSFFSTCLFRTVSPCWNLTMTCFKYGPMFQFIWDCDPSDVTGDASLLWWLFSSSSLSDTSSCKL